MCTTWCGSNACIVSISRRAPRACSNRFTARHMVVRIRSRWAFGPATHPRFPSRVVRLPFRATSLTRSGRRARPPSPQRGARFLPVFSFRKNLPSLRAHVGRGPLVTPVHSTDVCNSRFFFQGMLALRLGALHAVFSPRGAGTLGSRRVAHFSEPTGPPERCLLRSHRLCVPLTPRRFAGFPGGARLRPPASARRSSCDDPRVVPESLGLLHHAA